MHILLGFAILLGILWVLTATGWGRKVFLALSILLSIPGGFFIFAALFLQQNNPNFERGWAFFAGLILVMPLSGCLVYIQAKNN